MLKEYHRTDSRFAWLTPLPGHRHQSGPWLIVEDNTTLLNLEITDQCRKVSCDCLLQMVSDVLGVSGETGDETAAARWTSACGRFSVLRMKGVGDDSRLFVQRPDDYFSRLELYVNGELLAAFQEPVWPHLRQACPNASTHLSLSADCLDALQNGARADKSATDPLPRKKSMPSAA